MYKILLFLLLFPFFGMGQPGDIVLELLQHIRREQSTGGRDFTAGGFPSFREYQGRKGIYKNDDNVFFTGLVLMTLREHYPSFSPQQQLLADSIIRDALPSFHHFRNLQGRQTFNFWPTDPPVIFPDGGWLNLFNRPRALPDDLDATSISLLALDVPDSVASSVHQVMQEFSNNGRWELKKTFPEYDTMEVYSTWFGKKIPVDMDASVVCNILNMVNRYQLELSGVDSASISFLARIIRNRHHQSHPVKVSPYYGTTALILYHYSRLMEHAAYPVLEELKPQLINDALGEYNKATTLPEKIILRTALHRWGTEAPEDTIMLSDLEKDLGDAPFVFFIANMGAIFPEGIAHRVATGNAGRFNYYCPAYNYTLMLENLMSYRKQ